MRDKPEVLYMTYDGLLEPLGQSQIVPYLAGLAGAKGSFRTAVLSFDKASDMKDLKRAASLKELLASKGIDWISLRYHKYPKIISTLYDVIIGYFTGIRLIKKYGIKAAHARSYVPAAICAMLKKTCGVKFIFDMRGFWADERVEGGIWRKGWLYNAIRALEKRFLVYADEIITLTENAKRELLFRDYLKGQERKVAVIPTCADLNYFSPVAGVAGCAADGDDLKGKFVFVYTGSLGTWYDADAIFDFFIAAKKVIGPAHLIVLTREAAFAAGKAEEKGISGEDYTVRSVEYGAVAQILGRCDAGIAFYKQGFSRKGCAPVKVGEYLGCGLPVVATGGVGDLEDIFEESGAGVILGGLNTVEYEKAARKLASMAGDPSLEQKCRDAAIRYFSLDEGVRRYGNVYERVLGR